MSIMNRQYLEMYLSTSIECALDSATQDKKFPRSLVRIFATIYMVQHVAENNSYWRQDNTDPKHL